MKNEGRFRAIALSDPKKYARFVDADRAAPRSSAGPSTSSWPP